MANPSPSRAPILPHRIRCIDGSFAYIPHRFLRDGFFASLPPIELRLYVFLVLVADRQGLSFYGYERICSILEIDIDTYLQARDGLIARDMLAFDGTRFQVLALPPRPTFKSCHPLTTTEDFETRDPATVRHILDDAFPDARRK